MSMSSTTKVQAISVLGQQLQWHTHPQLWAPSQPKGVPLTLSHFCPVPALLSYPLREGESRK